MVWWSGHLDLIVASESRVFVASVESRISNLESRIMTDRQCARIRVMGCGMDGGVGRVWGAGSNLESRISNLVVIPGLGGSNIRSIEHLFESNKRSNSNRCSVIPNTFEQSFETRGNRHVTHPAGTIAPPDIRTAVRIGSSGPQRPTERPGRYRVRCDDGQHRETYDGPRPRRRRRPGSPRNGPRRPTGPRRRPTPA